MPRVWDSRETPPMADALREQLPEVERLGGALDAAALDGVTRVLKSPGLAPHDPSIAPLLAAARERGIPVQGELALFVEALAALKAEHGYAPQLVAITGTNGKTTTTALTALLIERAGKRVVAAGNIGPTLLDTLAAQLDELPEVWVLELSSFQLFGIEGFEADAATVLNISQDHLDWHGTLADYTQAKARIFGGAGTMVLNRDDAAVWALRPAPVEPAKMSKAKKARAAMPAPRPLLSFGLDAPRTAGDFGLHEQGGMVWLVRAQSGDDTEPSLQQLMPVDALRIRGRHNAANAMAALALASAIGCALAPMLHGLRE
jgi:UDP-N-acetylmuramoylalanine--D-glutamate ligase